MSKCRTGKKAYRSFDQAKSALTRIHQSGPMIEDGKIPRRAYICPHCHRYHLTAGLVANVFAEDGSEPPEPPRKLTPLEQAEADRDALEAIVRACIADGCGSCMHSVAWGRYQIDRMGRDRELQTAMEGRDHDPGE